MPRWGFEDTSWTLSGNAQLQSGIVYEGNYALQLNAPAPPAADIATSPRFRVTPGGSPYPVIFYIRTTLASANHAVSVQGSVNGFFWTQELFLAADKLKPDTWTRFETSAFTGPTSPWAYLRFVAQSDGDPTVVLFYIDKVSYVVSPVAKGMYDGWTGLKNGLETINGAGGGYWNDFTTSKVYDSLILPDDMQEMPEFYLCIPYVDEPESFVDMQRGVTSEWTQTIFAFVRESKDDPSSNKTVELISKIRDDLTRYLLNNPSLGGTVDVCEPVSGFRVAGHDTDAEYGEYQMQVKITQYIGGDDLGPDA